MLQVYAGLDALEHERTQRAVQLDAGQRVGLECAAGADAKRAEPAPLDELADDRAHGLERRRRPVAQQHAGHAAHAERAVSHRLRPRVAVEVQHNPTRALAKPRGTDVGDRALQVPGQMAQEQRSIAALETDLVVVHDEDGAQPAHGVSPARPPAFAREPAPRAC
jgi:hypothetical protein